MKADDKLQAQAQEHIGRTVSLWGNWTDGRPFHTGVLLAAGDDVSSDEEDGYCFLIRFDGDDKPTICPVKDFTTITVHKENN